MTPRDERLDDARMEQELERLLGTEPSPEFQARLRARVATEAMAPRGFAVWGWWLLPGAAIAGAAVVLVMLLGLNQQPRPSGEVRAAAPAPSTTVPVPRVPPAAESIGSHPATQRAPLGRRTPSSVAPVVDNVAVAPTPSGRRDPFSDVQVSASELKALRQLDALMAGKQLREEEAPRAAARDDMTDLMIAPIAIEPIQLVSIKGDAE